MGLYCQRVPRCSTRWQVSPTFATVRVLRGQLSEGWMGGWERPSVEQTLFELLPQSPLTKAQRYALDREAGSHMCPVPDTVTESFAYYASAGIDAGNPRSTIRVAHTTP